MGRRHITHQGFASTGQVYSMNKVTRMKIEPVTLTGKIVRLEPLSADHIPSLAKVGLDEKIWRYMRYGKVETIEQLTGLGA